MYKDNITVFRVEIENPLRQYRVLGRTLLEWSKLNLPSSVEIEDVKFLPSCNTSYIAIITSDTPLIDMSFLEKAAEKLETLGYPYGYSIGCGYIKRSGYEEKLDDTYNGTINAISVTMDTLNEIFRYLKLQILHKHMANGVLIMDTENTYIDDTVTISKDVTVYPNNFIRGNTVIGVGSVIFPFCDLYGVTLGERTEIRSTYATECYIGAECRVGPFSCIRAGSVIGDRCRIGDFVEIKNAILQKDVKAAHLSYVGDAEVGENTNIGCGAVFANYNGKIKQRTEVGSNVFIGCNTNLIAPLKIENDAYIAAGSTVTLDVPSSKFCIARAREVIKDIPSSLAKSFLNK